MKFPYGHNKSYLSDLSYVNQRSSFKLFSSFVRKFLFLNDKVSNSKSLKYSPYPTYRHNQWVTGVGNLSLSLINHSVLASQKCTSVKKTVSENLLFLLQIRTMRAPSWEVWTWPIYSPMLSECLLGTVINVQSNISFIYLSRI